MHYKNIHLCISILYYLVILILKIWKKIMITSIKIGNYLELYGRDSCLILISYKLLIHGSTTTQ